MVIRTGNLLVLAHYISRGACLHLLRPHEYSLLFQKYVSPTYRYYLSTFNIPRSFLESKCMLAIFQKKGKKKKKKEGGKGILIYENLGKNVQNLKIF